MEKRVSRRIIIGATALIAVAIIAQLLFHLNVYLEKRSNHEKVLSLINENLMFRWETMDEDLENINNWIDRGHFYNEDLGRLYERASLIYMQKGEILPYYRYLGYALYYLERSPEKDYTINVYLDLANFFLNNYADDSAKKMIDDALKIKDFEDIENLQVKSYAFRMLGIMAILDEEYESAEEYLEKAQDVLDQSNTGIFEDSYRAIDDAWLGRVYVEMGRFEECQEKLDKWEGHPMFNQDIYREIMLRDFIIPYYQVKCMCQTGMIYEGRDVMSYRDLVDKESKVGAIHKAFVDICEANGYKKTELYTLLRLQKKYPPKGAEAQEQMFNNLQRLYDELFAEQNSTYAYVIDGTVLNSMQEMDKYEQQEKFFVRRRRSIALAVITAIVLFAAVTIFILNSRVDGLTGLLNRKTLNRAIERAKKLDSHYGIIMMDIDHFKNVNDTYGHQNGDAVLSRLGEIILTESNLDVHCYRYGGEEFAILLDKRSVPYAENIAERIRSAMELERWDFDKGLVITISAGVAYGSREGDVLHQADENLYKSKEGGRNRITVSSV